MNASDTQIKPDTPVREGRTIHRAYMALVRGATVAVRYTPDRRGRLTGGVQVFGALVMLQVDYGLNASYEDAENLILFP